MSSRPPRILIYLLRRDLRLADNPVLHALTTQQAGAAPFTHVLPVYVVSAEQVEVAGFLRPGAKSPYPEARSLVAGFWRCGHHRAKFLAESLWDLKTALAKAGSGLEIRIGMLADVVGDMLAWYNGAEDEDKERGCVAGVWMTADEGVEETREEREVRRVAEKNNVAFKLWADEKFFVDE
ncbi:uncharacterized protein K452DRAFT_292949 [Aplosporella prunicola CBS 121167]|uniref:Photolyase/cryptochrome alpha/beta domain-containing protein n=1 Tax=Aplosporella prunicola CBS 121167 TaxID=1176127 RepID=A0A6A6AVX5_9PEZI|nr:uncharacterized protein K452DRAFT_292949 [Aplosporella prunicola CBS 121167]KAF2135756.1 hypothetical protein K452DRAFT_292949 [Aplosporella prunicola CBS 121167]